MKDLLNKIFPCIFLVMLAESTQAQFFEKRSYEASYFQWPVIAKVALVANFGELRSNHFHMGLDCRTEQMENKPVVAAAAGYIAKVKIEPWGFGRAIYINHPNGLTTLYAHLNDFYPALEQYIKERQYALQSWNVFIDLPAGMFPVTKGFRIAYSGNTGGSQGPHVHFEIRDTKTDNVLNPLLFDFPIPDNAPPDVLRLAVYDRCKSTYEQSPKLYPLRKVNGVYVPASGKLTVNTDRVSFAITAYDRYTGSTNQNGIYQAVLFDNNRAISGFQMDSISYLDTRYLNGHIDYKLRAGGGTYLQHLSRLPGNHSTIYKADATDGVVSFETEKDHAIRIEVADPNGNTSIVKFDISSVSSTKPAPARDSVHLFKPGFVNVFDNGDIRFYLNELALYDSFYFKYNQTKDVKGQPVHQVHNATVPLHNYFVLKIRNHLPAADTSKMVIYRSYGAKKDYKKAVYENGFFKAAFREFGNFQLLTDSTAPVISSPGFVNGMNASRLSRLLFTVTDNTEEINKFTAMLDGKWLRFSNDKGRNFIYKFDEKCGQGSHQLVITAEDQVGNVTTKTYNFIR